MNGEAAGAPRGCLGVWVCLTLVLLGSTACSPSRLLSRAMLRAPNTYPTWLAPAPRVTFRLPASLLTNLPTERIQVGPPPAELAVMHVPAGDYQVRVTSTNLFRRGRPEYRFSMKAVFPLTASEAGTEAQARGTVVILHGYGVDSLSMLPWGVILAEAGYQSVLVDLRGHGESSGRRFHFGTVEVRDVQQVLDRLLQEGRAREPVAVLGDSFGAALALRWAASDSRIVAVVALAPYAELLPAILGLREDYAAWVPRGWVDAAARRLPGALGVDPESLDTTSVAEGLQTPTLLVAAGQDGIAPAPAVGQLARLCAGPVKYLTVASAHHESLPFHFEELREVVVDWLEAYCR